MTALDAAAVMTRYGMPAESARYHTGGWHICVDGRNYSGSPTSGCLITDPAMERVARFFLAKTARPVEPRQLAFDLAGVAS